jgi:hypothetical protein
MAKQSGLGDQLFVAGYDLSGDVGSIQRIGRPSGVLDVTGINASGYERIHSTIDGEIAFNSFFNDAAAQEHVVLAAKGSGADRIVTYFHGSTIGNAAASLVSKQINYDGTRAEDGSLTFSIQALANAYGLDYGQMLTAGKRTDTTATNGSSLDGTASTSTGWTAYLQVFSFTGTSVTVTLQDSADNGSFASFTGSAFTAATGITTQRISGSTLSATVRRYVRVATTGTFSNAVFAVMFTRDQVVI